MLSERFTNALVTGGAQGIGRAIAEELARRGVSVVLLDRDGERASDTARSILAAGGRCSAVTADLASASDVEDAVARAKELLGGTVDLLVNNAGVIAAGYFASTSAAESMAQINVNFIAPIRLIHLLLPEMLQRGRGHIVNIASAGGLAPFPAVSVYTGTKFGLVGFSEALRAELSGTGVGLSVVCPGMTRTAIFDHGDQHVPRRWIDWINGRAVSPHEVARAAIRAIERNRALAVVTAPAAFGAFFHSHFPRTYRWGLSRIARYLRSEVVAPRSP